MRICAYVCMCVHVCVCTYIYIYIYIYTHTYTHIHIFFPRGSGAKQRASSLPTGSRRGVPDEAPSTVT